MYKSRINLWLLVPIILFNVVFMGGVHQAKADASAFAGGDGTPGQPYQIASAEHLNNVRNHMNAHFIMVADVDLSSYQSGAGWMPIGNLSLKFTGVFDGNGHTITGLRIDRSSTDFIGLFGHVGQDAIIRNVNLVDVHIEGNEHVGGLIGAMDRGQVLDASVTGSVYGGNKRTGGLVGYVYKGSILSSYSEANVDGTNQVGGLFGYLDGTIKDSYAKGFISGARYVGGLGGLTHPSSTIASSAAFANVQGSRDVGGFIGENDGKITNSYATGAVTGNMTVGGLVGANSDGSITNAYATGLVTGNSSVGGLVGSGTFASKVSGSYYDTTTTAQSDTGKGEGKPTADMHDESTYTGWDMTAIWGMDQAKNGGYPYLRTIQKFIVYDGNGHTSGHAPIDNLFYRQGTIAHVLGNTGNLMKDGHIFLGWNTEADGSGTSYDAGDALVIGGSDITLYAQWLTNSYTVTFDRNGGDTEADPQSMTVSHGDKIAALPAAPTRAGHIFAGWNTAKDGAGNDFDEHALIHGDLTVYAQWEKISYTVTFDRNGGDTEADPKTMTVSHGDTITALPVVPTRAGYTFVEWNTEREGTGNDFDEHTIIHDDLTVYAQWAKLSYTVTFDRNGGDTEADPQTMTVLHGDTFAALPVPPTRAGHTFVGWNTEEDGTGTDIDEQTEIMGDMTIYAQWERRVSSSPPTTPPPAPTPTTPTTPTIPMDNEPGDDVEEIDEDHNSGTNAEQEESQPSDPHVYFTDITGHWAEQPIIEAVSLGIVTGYPDHTFRPNQRITRAEFAVLLVHALKLQDLDAELNFSDADSIADWAKAGVASAVNAGIVKGYHDGTFRPHAYLTRAEMVSMAARALNLPMQNDVTTHFADDHEIPTWAKGAIDVMSQHNYVQGKKNNLFDPLSNTTRAEATVIIVKLVKGLI